MAASASDRSRRTANSRRDVLPHVRSTTWLGQHADMREHVPPDRWLNARLVSCQRVACGLGGTSAVDQPCQCCVQGRGRLASRGDSHLSHPMACWKARHPRSIPGDARLPPAVERSDQPRIFRDVVLTWRGHRTFCDSGRFLNAVGCFFDPSGRPRILTHDPGFRCARPRLNLCPSGIQWRRFPEN